MRVAKFFCFGLVVVWIFIDGVCARPRPGADLDFAKAISLLRELCGYSLDNSMLNKVKSSKSRFESDVFHADFYLELTPAGRRLMASLSFACVVKQKDMNGSGERVPLTARGEIANEDSGGRYSRHVVWERRYSGSNWSGTLAYVDSIFGDGSRLRIPAYILTCPKDIGLTCFSLEFERDDLTSEEVDEISNLIHGIFISNSPMK